jgi:hypothetical protein
MTGQFALPSQPVRHVTARLMMRRLRIHVLLLLQLQKTPCRFRLRTDDIILQCVELCLYLLLLQEQFSLIDRRHFYQMPGKIFQPPTAAPDRRLVLPESGVHGTACSASQQEQEAQQVLEFLQPPGEEEWPPG